MAIFTVFSSSFLQSKRHSDGFLLPYHYNNNGPVWAAQQANARGLKMGSMPFEVKLYVFAYFYTYIQFHEMFSRILFMNRSKLSFLCLHFLSLKNLSFLQGKKIVAVKRYDLVTINGIQVQFKPQVNRSPNSTSKRTSPPWACLLADQPQ